MTFTRSLSNSESQDQSKMQIQTTDDKIKRFLERKFRISRSYKTKATYMASLKRFIEFVRINYNLDLAQLVTQIKETKEIDPIDVLDEYFSFLSEYQLRGKRRIGYSAVAIKNYLKVAKEFLNGEGCKIYNEDVKQRFKLPRTVQTFYRGLTKETINRLVRLANPKLAALILIACSSGMRLGELVQLRLSDIDFSINPVTVTLRAQTTKTRQARITHISSEAKSAVNDYLARQNPPKKNDDYLFLLQHKDRLDMNAENKRMDHWKKLQSQIISMSEEEKFAKSVAATGHNLSQQLVRVIKDNPELNKKTENGRNEIHFHAFRYFFKTQVTDAHESDFAEALMGHKSLKLVYYRQNDKKRAETYLKVEPALTIADTEKIDRDFVELQENNQDLRSVVEGLSRQLRNLENKIQSNI